MNTYSDNNRHPCEAVLEGDWIVIAIHKNTIKHYTELHPQLEQYDAASEEFITPYIADLDSFVEDVVQAMNSEDEEGGTFITYAVDKAILEAVENGAEGIELQ